VSFHSPPQPRWEHQLLSETTFGTPNLFILGAAKCGTTSLWYVLSRHPDVQVSRVKEPSFFCSYFQDISNPVIYFSLFDENRKWRVDSSHVYLTNPESHEILSRLFPGARFILILRDPIKRAHALYRWMRRYNHADGNPYEPIDSFTEALHVENDRYHSSTFWKECRQYPWNFFYCRSSLYYEQVERYLKVYPLKQFLVLTLADFARDPTTACEQIAKFLQIDAGPLLVSDEWQFNVDASAEEPPVEAVDFLQPKLCDVQSRTEQLLGLSLNFSM